MNSDDDENKGDQKRALSVESSRIKLQPFWPTNPSVWFAQAEAQFNIFNITSDSTKFSHVISALPTEICEPIMPLILNPPKTEKYAKLKEALIARHALSTERRLEKLLEKAELGDRKPSEVYFSMKSLAGEAFDNKLVETLWFRKLPRVIYVSLTAMGEKDINDLLPVADKIYEITTPSVSTISNTEPSSSGDTELSEAVAAMKQFSERLYSVESKLAKLNLNRSRSSFSNYRSKSPYRRPRSHSRKRSNDNRFCYYHNKFGSNARKCYKPCSFRSNKPESTNETQKND